MEDNDKDIELMLRFQNGEERCFEELVERHKQRVFNVAYRYLGNVHDAEDAAQQVFINIYYSKNRYSPSAQFTTWLYTICKNTCLKTFRKKRLPAVFMDAELFLEEGSVPAQISDPNTDTPLEDVLIREQESLVKDAIDALPENQKMVLILYKYEQLSYDEIARITGLSAKAVKSLLHRARTNLKEQLSDYFKK